MKEGVFVHDTAEVSDRANLGRNSKIWNLVQIRDGVEIGKNCILSKNVYIDFDVKVGNNVKIQNNVSVYNGVTIEDDVFVGPCVVFTNDLMPRAVVNEWNITETLIKKGASLGANCTIVCGNIVGEYAVVAAGSVVTKSVSPNTLVLGNPAKAVAFVYNSGRKVEISDIKEVTLETVIFKAPSDKELLALPVSALRLLPSKI